MSKELKSDSYYWRFNVESIQHAYLHIDEDNPNKTFLIIFDNSDATNYHVYTQLREKGNDNNQSKKAISEFIDDVMRVVKTDEERQKQWMFNGKPEMVISERMKIIVRETTKKVISNEEK